MYRNVISVDSCPMTEAMVSMGNCLRMIDEQMEFNKQLMAKQELKGVKEIQKQAREQSEDGQLMVGKALKQAIGMRVWGNGDICLQILSCCCHSPRHAHRIICASCTFGESRFRVVHHQPWSNAVC